MGIREGLAKKYGLARIPTQDDVDLWEDRTRELQMSGMALFRAAAMAARKTFPDYGSRPASAEISIFTLLPLDIVQIAAPAARPGTGATPGA